MWFNTLPKVRQTVVSSMLLGVKKVNMLFYPHSICAQYVNMRAKLTA
jgi:hypothetical protein